MEKQKEFALEYSNKWLEIIKNKENPNINEADWMIKESVSNFKNHFNS
ncbi:hypothetical protein GW891_00715 [bacterium]|nr:hypothetical protein [bacterium]